MAGVGWVTAWAQLGVQGHLALTKTSLRLPVTFPCSIWEPGTAQPWPGAPFCPFPWGHFIFHFRKREARRAFLTPRLDLQFYHIPVVPGQPQPSVSSGQSLGTGILRGRTRGSRNSHPLLPCSKNEEGGRQHGQCWAQFGVQFSSDSRPHLQENP